MPIPAVSKSLTRSAIKRSSQKQLVAGSQGIKAWICIWRPAGPLRADHNSCIHRLGYWPGDQTCQTPAAEPGCR